MYIVAQHKILRQKRYFFYKMDRIFYFAGSLVLSCLLGVALTILIILTVFYLRAHFNLTQFYPNHVKLFSKDQLSTESEKCVPIESDKNKGGWAKLMQVYRHSIFISLNSNTETFLSCHYQRKYFRSKFKGCLIALFFRRILSKFSQKSYFSWQHQWKWILQTNNEIANIWPQGS